MVSLRSRIVCCCSALVLACAAGGAQGAGASVQVTATVLKHARLNVIAAPVAVVISESDLARGYVDVPDGGQFAIQSNSTAGYVLEFNADPAFLRRIEVSGLGPRVEFGPSGGSVVRHADRAALGGSTVSLGFRFMLAESARPGVHAWPVRLAIASL